MSHDATAEALRRQSEVAARLLTELRIEDDADLAHDTVEGETGLFEAIAAAVGEIDKCEIIASGCRAKEAEVAKRRGRAEARAARVRASLEQAMLLADLPTVRLPTATLTVKAVPPKALIADESLIPSEFWQPQPPKLDKRALAEAAKHGHVPGVEMSNGGVSLQIRRS